MSRKFKKWPSKRGLWGQKMIYDLILIFYHFFLNGDLDLIFYQVLDDDLDLIFYHFLNDLSNVCSLEMEFPDLSLHLLVSDMRIYELIFWKAAKLQSFECILPPHLGPILLSNLKNATKATKAKKIYLNWKGPRAFSVIWGKRLFLFVLQNYYFCGWDERGFEGSVLCLFDHFLHERPGKSSSRQTPCLAVYLIFCSA
jgi:hypothetical protein